MKKIFHILFFIIVLLPIANHVKAIDEVWASDGSSTDSIGVSADTTLIDSTVVDSTVVDSTVVDSIVVDSTVVDSTVVDSTVVDSTVVDSTVVDSTVVDSTVVDTLVVIEPSGFFVAPAYPTYYQDLSDISITLEGISEILDINNGSAALMKGEEALVLKDSIVVDSVNRNVIRLDFSALKEMARDSVIARGEKELNIHLLLKGDLIFKNDSVDRSSPYHLVFDSRNTNAHWSFDVFEEPTGYTILPSNTKKLSSYELLKTVNITFEGVDSLSHGLVSDSLHIKASLFNEDEEFVYTVGDSCISFVGNVMTIDFSELPAEAFLTHTVAESMTVALKVEGTLLCDFCTYDFVIGEEGSEYIWNVRKTYQEIKDLDTNSISIEPNPDSNLSSYEELKKIVLTLNGFEKASADPLSNNDPSIQLYLGKNRIATSYGEFEGNRLVFNVPNLNKEIVESADINEVFVFTANIDAQLNLDGDVYAFDMSGVQWTVPAVYKMNYKAINTTDAEVLSLSGSKETRNSYAGNIVIPAKVEINGKEYTVTRIGANAFANCYDNLISVQLPNTITEISTSAFESCTGLTKISIPENVKTIGKQAFYNCSGLVDVHSWAESPKIDNTVFSGINQNCSLYVPKEYMNSWYNYGGTADFKNGYWTKYFSQSYPIVVGPTSHSISPECGDISSYEVLKNITVSFEGIDSISSADGYDLNATLWMDDEIIATASDIAYGNKMLSFTFDSLSEEMFTVHEEGVIKSVALKVDGKVVIDECYFDLQVGVEDNDGAVWNVPMHYIPNVFPLDIVAVNFTPEREKTVDSYTSLKEIILSFDTFEKIEIDRLGAGFVQARLRKEGSSLFELSTDDVVVDGNKMYLDFSGLSEKDVMVSAEDSISSFDFSLDISVQILLDGTTYAFNTVEEDNGPHWIVPTLQMPVPDDIVVMIDSIQSYNDLKRISLCFKGVDEIASPNVCAKLMLDGTDYVEAEKLEVESNVLTLLFTQMRDEDFAVISSDSIMRTLTLFAEGELKVKTDSVQNFYNYAFKLDNDSLTWSVPAVLIAEPSVTVSTPSADIPVTFEDLKEIVVSLDGFESLEVVNVTRATLYRHDTQKDVCSIGTSSIDIEGTTLVLNFNELDKESVAITPEDDETLGVTLSLCLEVDVLLDGMPYHLVVNKDKNDNVTWNLEAIVVFKLPNPTLSYSNGHLSMSCGNFKVTYHYEITNPDGQEEPIEIVAEKNGNTNSANVPIDQIYTIKVFATKENFKDSDVVTYNLYLYGHTPEIKSGVVGSDGELVLQ